MKKRKTVDVKPIVFTTFNSRKGKATPMMLKALMDSGGSGKLVLSKHAHKLRCKKTARKQSKQNCLDYSRRGNEDQHEMSGDICDS